MALRKATFSITTDAFGYGEDDTRVTPTAATRPSVLRSVELTDGAGGAPKVTLYEAPYDSTDLVYEYGTQLFYSASLDADRVYPRLSTVDDVGVAISGEESGDIYFDEQYLRCTIEDGVALSDYTVVIIYETAGDYRF